MKSNGLLKWLMIPVALLVLFVAIRQFPGGKAGAPSPANPGGQLTVEEMKALGIEGGTPRDTVATLVGPGKQLRTEQQAATERQQTEGLLADLQRRLDSLGGRGGGHADLPVGLGLGDGDAPTTETGLSWVEPQDAKKAEGRAGAGGATTFPTSFGAAKDPAEPGPQTMATAKAKSTKPVFTAATNSTLMGSVA